MQDAVWLIMVLKTMLQLAVAKLIDNKWESFYSLNDAWISYMYRVWFLNFDWTNAKVGKTF